MLFVCASAGASRAEDAPTAPTSPTSPTSPSASSDAEALVRDGVTLRRAHRNEEALAAFKKAYAREASPSTRAQIGFAEQALGRWIDAESDLAAALETKDEWIDRHRAQLEEALRVIDTHLAWLKVDVNLPSAEIRLDDAKIESGHEVRTTEGAHRIVVRGGATSQTRMVEIASREHARTIFVLDATSAGMESAPVLAPPAEERAHAKPANADASHGPSRIGPIVLGGLGVAGIIAGSAFGIEAINARSDRDNNCNRDTNVCNPDGIAAHNRLVGATTAADVAFGAGGAAIAGAIVWWILQTPRAPVSAGLGGPNGSIGATVLGRF